MWTNVICSILGFVAGCSFRDLLGKKKTRGDSPKRIYPSPVKERKDYKITENKNLEKDQSNNSAFSLNAIHEVFSTYNVDMISASSFGVLRRKIKSDCYKNLLKLFIDKATSPEKMVTMLKENTTPTFVLNLKPSTQPPFIDEEKLDKYIKEENASPDEIGTMDEKVKFLLTMSYGRGIENFKITLGAYLTEILDGAERGEDITELYLKAMKIIKSRYEYVS